MKKIIIYYILLSVFAMAFSTCRKVDVPPLPDLRFPLPLLTKDTTSDVFIHGEDPASFLGKFMVDLYYGQAVKPKKMNVVVIRNDNKINVKTIKADVTSFPASIQVTGTELTTLFDSTINVGDKFEIGADVTTINGQKFQAFPVTGKPYGADTTALPGSRFSIVYVVQAPPDLRFPLPLLTKDTTSDMFIPGEDPASFLGKFIIDMYYGTAVKPQKVDIVVIRNDNKTNVKTIKADVTSFPSSIEVTGTELTTLFDSTIHVGDKFEIGADVTTINGQRFEAFPVTGTPYGADTSALPGSRFSIVYVVQPPPDLRFPLPLLTKDTNGDMFIPRDDPASFLGKFIIDMYYGTAVKPQKVDIVVIRNDNKTNVKIIKANVTTFPASIQVTGTELTTLFDSTIKQGDKFEIGADVTTINGQKFEAFPVTGNPYGADTAALPGSRFSIVYVTTCTFDKNSFNGQYTVVRNTIGDADWGDLKVGDLVYVRPGTGENDLVVVAYPYNTLVYPPYPMICQVNPVTFEVTVPRQLIGVPMYSYPYLWVEQGTGPGTVNPCGDAITLNMILSAVYDIGTPYSVAGILELRK